MEKQKEMTNFGNQTKAYELLLSYIPDKVLNELEEQALKFIIYDLTLCWDDMEIATINFYERHFDQLVYAVIEEVAKIRVSYLIENADDNPFDYYPEDVLHENIHSIYDRFEERLQDNKTK